MSNLVVKSNELNSISLFKNTLALKVFAKLITVIRENPNDEFFKLPIKELFEDFKGSKDNYTYIKKTIKSMGMVEIGQQEKGFFLVSTFSKVRAENGIIDFKINEDLKPHILGLLNNFTSYYFENIAPLKSGFSIRIYEILKQWEKVGNKKFSIVAIRELLGIEENKYKLYGHFKAKIILLAQKELEEKTDIKFDFEEIKTGRRITDIHFFIKPNHKKIIEAKTNKEEFSITPSIKKLFNSLKIPLTTQKKLFTSYQEEKLLNNLRYTQKELEKGKIKSNTTAFLISALKNDYANQTNLFNSKELKQEKQDEQKTKEKELEKVKADFTEKRDKKVFDYIEKNRKELGKDFADFINSAKPHFEKLNIKSDDFEEQKIRDLINTDNQTKMYFRFFIMKKIMKKEESDFEEFLKIQK